MSLSKFNELNLSNDFTENYKVIIAGLTGGPVTGSMNNDIPISTGNDFSDAKEALEGIIGAVGGGRLLDLKNQIGSAARLAGGSATTALETRKIWNNSTMPSIPVEFTLYQSSADDESIIERVLRLQRATLPNKSGAVFTAPNNFSYTGRADLNASGTLILQIGTWFRADKLLLNDMNVTYSKEVNSLGQPIEAIVTANFIPFRVLTYDEFKRWFLI